MAKLKNETGHRYGMLTVLRMCETRTNLGQIKWVVKCNCGSIFSVRGGDLRNGHTAACVPCGKTKHGKSRAKIYKNWTDIKQRCRNKKHKHYHNYGGRGITVCDRWFKSFKSFYADMGDKPSTKHTIDRIDNDGNYEKGNCRWATYGEQLINRRNTVYLTYNGITKPAKTWSIEYGLSISVLLNRLRMGWTPHRALTQHVYTHSKAA